MQLKILASVIIQNGTISEVIMKAVNIKYDTDGMKVDLPKEIELPADMTDEDEISDYISNVTGFCHFGFELKE